MPAFVKIFQLITKAKTAIARPISQKVPRTPKMAATAPASDALVVDVVYVESNELYMLKFFPFEKLVLFKEILTHKNWFFDIFS